MTNIAVDKQKLAQRLGLADWPEYPRIDTDFQAMAARAVTDFNGSPVAALSNSESWIRSAYADGKQAGKLEERAYWEAKLRNVFGLSR